MALWKARSSSPEQKVEVVEEESEAKRPQTEECGSLFMGVEDVKMLEVYSSVLSVDANSLMELFSGGPIEHKVMQKAGCLNYSTTPWEPVNHNTFERQISYKFDRSLSFHGGEATATQQKSPLPDNNGWMIEEVMTLQGVLLGDYFNLQLKYQLRDATCKPKRSNAQIFLGIAWLKSTKHQKKITKNIISNISVRIKEIFSEVEKEFQN